MAELDMHTLSMSREERKASRMVTHSCAFAGATNLLDFLPQWACYNLYGLLIAKHARSF